MPQSQTFRKSKRSNFSKKIYSRRQPLFFYSEQNKDEKNPKKWQKQQESSFFTTKENGKWEQWRQIFILDKVKGVFSQVCTYACNYIICICSQFYNIISQICKCILFEQFYYILYNPNLLQYFDTKVFLTYSLHEKFYAIYYI